MVYYYLLDQFVNRKKEGNLNPNYPLKLKKKVFFSKNVYFSKKIILHLFIYFSFFFLRKEERVKGKGKVT